MRSNKIKIGLVLLLGLLTINTASANPGFTVNVDPVSSTVGPGETATYSVDIKAIEGLDVDEFAVLSISVTDPNGNPVIWTPIFSENSFIIGPDSPEKTVALEVSVPSGTPLGEYILTVRGDGHFPDDSDPTTPDTSWSVESSEFPLTVSVTQIPEFPTIALPVISALGIVFLASRRKEGNS